MGAERGSQVLTKQMPARRRRTRVHTLVVRQRDVTTVTLSCCRTLGGGWFVPSRPQPMARHRAPLRTPWPCSGSLATCTLVLMVADPLSYSGQDRASKSHRAVGADLPLLVCFPSGGPRIVLGFYGGAWLPCRVLPARSVSFPICEGEAATVAQGELEGVLSAVNSRHQTVGDTTDNKTLVLSVTGSNSSASSPQAECGEFCPVSPRQGLSLPSATGCQQSQQPVAGGLLRAQQRCLVGLMSQVTQVGTEAQRWPSQLEPLLCPPHASGPRPLH